MTQLVASGTQRDQVSVFIIPWHEPRTGNAVYMILAVVYYKTIFRTALFASITVPVENMTHSGGPKVIPEHCTVCTIHCHRLELLNSKHGGHSLFTNDLRLSRIFNPFRLKSHFTKLDGSCEVYVHFNENNSCIAHSPLVEQSYFIDNIAMLDWNWEIYLHSKKNKNDSTQNEEMFT